LPPEAVFFEAAGALFAPALAGVVVAATLSAIMSTVDSQLLVVGASVSHDLGLAQKFGGREVLISRLAIALVAAAAIALTLGLPSSIFSRTLFAWTALGAAFGPTVVFRAFGARPRGEAVLAAILCAFGLALIFEFGVPAGPGDVYARTLPWILGLGVLTAAQMARPNPAAAEESRSEAAPGMAPSK
jgi:Na+/proline symporter